MIADLHLVLAFALVGAKLLGVLARRLGFPSVAGEILAGLLLGPAVLGVLPSAAGAPDVHAAFEEIAQIGLCVLLFRVGLETDLRGLAAIGSAALGVAVCGMILPLALGSLAALALGWPPVASLFVGCALTATSMGVTASVLNEANRLDSPEGRIVMGAAVVDDVLGLVLLAGIVAVIQPDQSAVSAVPLSLVQAAAFLGAGVWLGPKVAQSFARLAAWAGQQALFLVLSFAYLLAMAWAAHAIGLAMIVGAFAAGLAFSGNSHQEELRRDLRPLTDLLTPLFFILIGASIELTGLLTSSTAWIATSLLLGAAVAGKMLSGAFLRPVMNRWAVGSGMMPRGEVGLVFAQMGLALDLHTQEQYSTLVIVLVLTTILGPWMLRLSLARPSG